LTTVSSLHSEEEEEEEGEEEEGEEEEKAASSAAVSPCVGGWAQQRGPSKFFWLRARPAWLAEQAAAAPWVPQPTHNLCIFLSAPACCEPRVF